MLRTRTRTVLYSLVQALEIFTEEELKRWWNVRLGKLRSSECFLEFGLDWDEFSSELESLPDQLPLSLALATFQEHKWFRFLGVSEGLFFSSVDEELQAIRLGVSLRTYLKRNDLGIGNSCSIAVKMAQKLYSGIYLVS
ncbi:MAG: hypothetical protein AABZ60_11155 [Planctomycetota bacterium]